MQQSRSASTENVKRRRPERTPDQIARKRDQDREAQRLSRERTRRRIDEAETRLAESQAAAARYEQIINQAQEERDVARREAMELRERLESTYAQLEAARARLASVSRLIGTDESQANSPSGLPVDSGISFYQISRPLQLQSPQASDSMVSRGPSNRSDHLSIRYQRQISPASVSPGPHEAVLIPSWNHRSTTRIDSHSSPGCGTEGSAYGSPNSVYSWSDLPNLVPKNSAPTCPMDSIITIFTNSRQTLLKNGEPEDLVLGNRVPPMSMLPSLGLGAGPKAQHPVTQMLTEVMAKVQIFHRIPEQVAFVWFTHLTLRFVIFPSRENYEALPDWARPTNLQMVTAHPPWIDHIPWPQVRNFLIGHSTRFLQEEFSMPYFAGLSVNWPHDLDHATTTDPVSGEVVISSAFEHHLRNLDNWSLGTVFSQTYPELAGLYRAGA
ncbi:hypothetical protein AAFC00_002314 [Neodothiora populina]|uniref:BZIP transcription factor n=1 Tax=Neodothiora populina TaxID=2781224 RepID=A0ABR3PH13_9PEZI